MPEEYAGNDFLRRCRNLEKRIYQGVEQIESPRVFKKLVFSKVLFDEKNEGSDEYDFYFNAKRFGISMCRVTSKILLLEPPLNLGKKFRHGKYFVYFRRKHPKENMIQKQISFSYRVGLLLKAFKYSKMEALGLIVLKALGFLSFSLGMFTGLFDRRIQRLCTSVKEEFDMIGEGYELRMYRGSPGNKFVDRIEREKGIFDLLQAWKLIVEKRPTASLLVIGDGIEHEHAKRFTEENGISNNVIFTGPIYGEEKYDLLKKCKMGPRIPLEMEEKRERDTRPYLGMGLFLGII